MKSLILIGGGGHCHSCIDVIETTDEYSVKGIVAENLSDSKSLLGYPIVGVDDDIPNIIKDCNLGLVSVGQIKSPNLRIKLYNLLKTAGAELPVVFSKYGYCSKHSIIGEGTIIMHGAVVNAGVVIGVNSIVNNQALLDHNVEIGDHCHISTGAKVNGGVRIGTGSFIGSGAIIKEGVEIGAYAVIGAGQIILQNVEPNKIIKGNHGEL